MDGVDAVLAAAKADHDGGDHQLAAELTQIALRADPDNTDARLLKAAALRARGYQELNPIARSWYLTGALELEGAIDPTAILQQMSAMFAEGATPADTVRSWRYHLDADKASGQQLTVGLRFTDSGDELTIRVRHSILLVDDGIADDCDTVVELTHRRRPGWHIRGHHRRRRRHSVANADQLAGPGGLRFPHAHAVAAATQPPCHDQRSDEPGAEHDTDSPVAAGTVSCITAVTTS